MNDDQDAIHAVEIKSDQFVPRNSNFENDQRLPNIAGSLSIGSYFSSCHDSLVNGPFPHFP